MVSHTGATEHKKSQRLLAPQFLCRKLASGFIGKNVDEDCVAGSLWLGHGEERVCDL